MTCPELGGEHSCLFPLNLLYLGVERIGWTKIDKWVNPCLQRRRDRALLVADSVERERFLNGDLSRNGDNTQRGLGEDQAKLAIRNNSIQP